MRLDLLRHSLYCSDLEQNPVSLRCAWTVWFNLYVDLKSKTNEQTKLTETENRWMVIRGKGGWGASKIGEGEN